MTDRTTRTRFLPRRGRARALVVVGALVLLVIGILLVAGGSRGGEVDRLVDLLQLREGMTVAEVGAGTGWLTVEIAERVGPGGRVYSTELSPRLDNVRESVAEAGLTNVTVVPAEEQSANLPPGCCDAVFMRRVYHHFSAPAAIIGDLFDALVPGGRLIIIEFEADGMLGMVTRMGIDETRLIEEVSAAGFDVMSVDEWRGWDHYVAVFQKPTSE